MIEIDLVLKELANTTGKRKGDLKRSYNSIKKKKEAEGLDKIIPEDVLKRIILLGVCNKIDVDAEEMDMVIEGLESGEEEEEVEEAEDDTDDYDEIEFEKEDDEEIDPYIEITNETGITKKELRKMVREKQEELKGLISEEGALFIIGKELGVDITLKHDEDEEELGYDEFDSVEAMGGPINEGSWEDIFSSTPEPGEGTDYEILESLLILAGTEYILNLADPTEMPYKHEGIGTYDDKPYTSRAMDVLLVDLSPIRKFKEKYEKGDFRGKKCFVKGKKYKLWLSEAAFKWFAKFWRDLERKSPDGRNWTYEKVKKEDVTKHYFGEV